MKTQNAVFGRSSKSFGSSVAYTLNGQNIVRTKPMTVANPQSPAQRQQRVRFKAFVDVSNTLPDAELNFLIGTKVTGQNRRSTLQQQLAPAYGAEASQDPTVKFGYTPTFDIQQLSDVGTGGVSYTGDWEEITMSNGVGTITSQVLEGLLNNTINATDTDYVYVVAISEDGCVMQISDTNETISSIRAKIGESQNVVVSLSRLDGHGNTAYVYFATAAESLSLTGLGTFSVAQRNARKSHNPLHNRPV